MKSLKANEKMTELLKHFWRMGLRIVLGMSIGYAIATLCLPWFFNFEIKNIINERGIELNP